MKKLITGIVCEYNPFHNGHLYQLESVKKAGADAIVCVMSGNFVQRGECAAIDKWKRAEMAVKCGADVVVELPTPWACASAETFARGGVGLLMDFGVDSVSFGCEIADFSLLKKCSEMYKDESFVLLVKENMSKGMTYPRAVSNAAAILFGDEISGFVDSPNNTLAVEYMKAISAFEKEIKIIPVLRRGSAHDSNETLQNFASANLLRSMNLNEDIEPFMPKKAYDVVKTATKSGFAPCNISFVERAVISSLRELSKDEYSDYVSDENGLTSRIYEAVQKSDSLSEIYDSVKVKNYTHARIRREIMMLYLRCQKNLSEGGVPYMKILAVSKRGVSLLKNAKHNSSVPIITKHSDTQSLDERGKAVYKFECSATDKFALCSQKIRACGLEATHSLKIIE